MTTLLEETPIGEENIDETQVGQSEKPVEETDEAEEVNEGVEYDGDEDVDDDKDGDDDTLV